MMKAERDARVVIRKIIANLQGSICPVCGISLSRAPKGLLDIRVRNWKTTLEHVIPTAMGGMDRPGNYLASHKYCNERKGNRSPTGCELIWLLAVNCRLGVEPQRW